MYTVQCALRNSLFRCWLNWSPSRQVKGEGGLSTSSALSARPPHSACTIWCAVWCAVWCTIWCAVHLKAHQCEPRITRRSALKKDGKCWRLELRWLIVIDDLLSCSLFLLLFLIFHLLSTFHPPHLVITVRFAREQMRKESEVHPPTNLLLQNHAPAT